MAISFPPSPSPGDIYTYGNRSWLWNGSGWQAYPGVLAASIIINSTSITAGTSGRLLYDNAGLVGETAGITTNGSNLTLSTGNLSFQGSNQRITGDFSTATVANRPMFQSINTSGTGNTAIIAIPATGGSYQDALFEANNDPNGGTNGQAIQLVADTPGANKVGIIAQKRGTASYPNFFLNVAGVDKIQIDSTSGNISLPSGNLIFSGSSQLITGDFSVLPVSTRAKFQSNNASATPFGATGILAIASTTGNNAFFAANSDGATGGDNGQEIQIATTGANTVSLVATKRGTATQPSLQLNIATTTALSIDSSSNISIPVGNLTFSNASTGQRIRGDFSTTTVSNRPMFQSTDTVGTGNTGVLAIPSSGGTYQNALFEANNDPNGGTNGQIIQLVADQIGSNRVSITAQKRGTAAYPNFAINVAGVDKIQIDATSGDISLPSGDLVFSGTAQRITGNFSDATVSNRPIFQSNYATGPFAATGVLAIPAAVDTGLNAFFAANTDNVTDGANGQEIQLATIGGGTVGVVATKRGTATQPNFELRMGATPVFSVTNTTNVPTILPSVAPSSGGSTSAVLVFGSTSGFGIYFGSSAPTISAAQGSIYLRTDGSTTTSRMYINTDGTTGWTAVTTVT